MSISPLHTGLPANSVLPLTLPDALNQILDFVKSDNFAKVAGDRHGFTLGLKTVLDAGSQNFPIVHSTVSELVNGAVKRGFLNESAARVFFANAEQGATSDLIVQMFAFDALQNVPIPPTVGELLAAQTALVVFIKSKNFQRVYPEGKERLDTALSRIREEAKQDIFSCSHSHAFFEELFESIIEKAVSAKYLKLDVKTAYLHLNTNRYQFASEVIVKLRNP